MAEQKRHHIEELMTIEENCLYTAQAHFIIHGQKSGTVKWVGVASSCIAALAGGLVASGLSPVIGVAGAIGGLVSALLTGFGVNKESYEHLAAAKLLTRLRQDARYLRETLSHDLSQREFSRAVQRLAVRHSSVMEALPETSDAAFSRARERIRDGRFEMDFREANGEISESQRPDGASPGT